MSDTAREPRKQRRTQHPDEVRMTLVEQLTELRSRLVKSSAALIAGIVVAYFLFGPILRFLERPYCDLPPRYRYGGGSCTLFVTGVLDQFLVRMRVSLWCGAIIASPVWLWQLWAFVTPGLHQRERRWALPFVVSSILLFAAGAAFSYYTLSNGLRFLLGIGGHGIVSLLTV